MSARTEVKISQSDVDDMLNLAREGLDVSCSLAKIALIAMESKEHYPGQDCLADVFNAIWCLTERTGEALFCTAQRHGLSGSSDEAKRREDAFYGNFGRRRP